jgi:hypothetical protein
VTRGRPGDAKQGERMPSPRTKNAPCEKKKSASAQKEEWDNPVSTKKAGQRNTNFSLYNLKKAFLNKIIKWLLFSVKRLTSTTTHYLLCF